MKTSTRYLLIISMLILVVLLGTRLTQAREASPGGVDGIPAKLPWAYQYIQQQLDPPSDIGGYVSMALIPFNNFLALSYYDATNYVLMGAAPVPNHAGNCGTNNNWACVTLDDGGGQPTGMFTSIDLWGYAADNWKMGISYYDQTHRSMKVAIYTCTTTPCQGWSLETIRNPDAVNEAVGLYSSFKFNSTGNAGVAFLSTNTDNLFSVLLYAYQVPSGGDCGEGSVAGKWECDEAFLMDGEGRYASLDFDYEDTPYVAVYDAHYGELWLVWKGYMCGVELGWGCLVVDGGDDDVGLYPSLIAPRSAADPYRIAYHDKTNGHLKYFDSLWGEPVVVDETSFSLEPIGISLQLDQDGYPVIAYQAIESDFSPPALRLARPVEVYGEDPYGNCGDPPPGYLFQYWRCTTLDDGGQYTEEADFLSMVINSNGMLGIAYTEYDWGLEARSLKFAYQTYFKTYLPVTAK